MQWMKTTLTFLLGAATLGIIILFLHLNTHILVVEIHWNQGFRGSDKLVIQSEFTARNFSRIRRETTSFHFIPGATLVLTPSELNSSCPDEICLGKLSASEREYYEQCKNKVIHAYEKFGPIQNSSCHFLNGTNRYPVALASFPGSGSTWLRGLLEKITGICTGQMLYYYYSLLRHFHLAHCCTLYRCHIL